MFGDKKLIAALQEDIAYLRMENSRLVGLLNPKNPHTPVPPAPPREDNIPQQVGRGVMTRGVVMDAARDIIRKKVEEAKNAIRPSR